MNTKRIEDAVYDVYCEKGFASACDEANKYEVCRYEFCNMCDCEAPVIKGDHICLVCGSTTVNELKDELDKENI